MKIHIKYRKNAPLFMWRIFQRKEKTNSGREAISAWLPIVDSNNNYKIQSFMCYHYTNRQYTGSRNCNPIAVLVGSATSAAFYPQKTNSCFNDNCLLKYRSYIISTSVLVWVCLTLPPSRRYQLVATVSVAWSRYSGLNRELQDTKLMFYH